jgi:hypothetical protein
VATLPDSESEPRDFAGGIARGERAENVAEAESWHEELYEPPLSFPVTADHALAQAELGQAHHAAHQANAHATSEAFAAHIARYERTKSSGGPGAWSYAAELGEALEKHAIGQVTPLQTP